MATEHQIAAAARKEKRLVGAGRLLDEHAVAGAGQTYGIDDDDAAAAEIALRRIANRHNCAAPRRLREAVSAGLVEFAADVQEHPAAYCGDPRHDDDAEALAEVLQALGLRGTPRPRTRRSPIDRPREVTRRGTCTVCERRYALRVDGTVSRHGCDGEGRPPVEAGT